MHAKLLVETTDPSEFEYIIEEKTSQGSENIYIQGPYAMAGGVNKNKRSYCPTEMTAEVARYNEHMIQTGRALGELNHPTSADVDLERACHMVTELKASKGDSNIYMGKSKVLSTPSGLIVKSLIRDGCSVGMSTRSLGKLVTESDDEDVSRVQDMRLIAIDCVADPSYGEAFVNGILESKQYVLDTYGQYVEAYETFEEGLTSLPRTDVEQYIKSSILTFLDAIKTKK
jgi:hypothetical protein